MKPSTALLASAILLAACAPVAPGPGVDTTDGSGAVTGSSLPGGTITASGAVSGMTEKNAEWNTYSNARLGFAIDVPKRVYAPVFAADRTSEMTAVEDPAGNRVFLAPRILGSGPADEPVPATLATLTATGGTQYPHWEIVARDIADDAALDRFIKERYGRDCSAGERKELTSGTYNVAIAGTRSPEDGDCFVNYLTVIRYSPARRRVISWHMGQAPTFLADADATRTYDQDIAASFRFL